MSFLKVFFIEFYILFDYNKKRSQILCLNLYQIFRFLHAVNIYEKSLYRVSFNRNNESRQRVNMKKSDAGLHAGLHASFHKTWIILIVLWGIWCDAHWSNEASAAATLDKHEATNISQSIVSAIVDVIGRCNDGLGVFEQRRDICIQLSSERWCRVRI